MEALKLVTPMQKSHSNSAPVQYVGNNGRAIDLTSSGLTWGSSAKNLPPPLWKFSTHAPVFLVAVSKELPPFYQEFDFSTQTNREAFWKELKNTSLDSSLANSRERASTQIPCNYTPRVISCLTRQRYWQTTYNFSWFQEQYLKTHIDNETYGTPCDKENSNELIRSIAEVVHAPLDAVQEYYTSFKAEFLRELDGQRRKAEAAKKAAEKRAETVKFLAEKAGETQKMDIKRWDAMVRRYTVLTLSDVQIQRIDRLRESYLKSIHKKSSVWESKIEDLLKVTQSVESTNRAQKLFPSKASAVKEPSITTEEPILETRRAMPLELHDFVKSIDETIERQKKSFAGLAEAPPLQTAEKKKKSKSKEKEEDSK